MNLEHITRVARFAKENGGTGPLSTGESLAAALVLNRADWLQDLGYTIPEALFRVDEEANTIDNLIEAQRQLFREGVL